MSGNRRLRPGDIDLGHPDAFQDGQPFAYFEVLRREAPVHWNPPHGQDCGLGPIHEGFFVLTRYADGVEVSRRPELFSSFDGTSALADREPEEIAAMRQMMINQDPPEHNAYRRRVSSGFTPRMVQTLEEGIREKAREIVGAVAREGHCEFVEDLAAELPLILICELLGVPQEDRYRIFAWSNQMVGGEDPEVSSPELQQSAAMQSWAYAEELAAAKRAAPDDSLISRFLRGADSEEGVSPEEIAFFFILLQSAGSETTRNATTHGVRLFCEHPDQLALLRSDLERYLPSAVEEVLRVSSPVIMMRRTATADTEIRGVTIARGQKIGMYYGSFNRDEEVFERPNDFDITRDPNPHVAFGVGQHFCLGANLARMQLRCIFREIYTQLDGLEVVGPPRLQRGALIDGVRAMPVRFSRRA